MIPSSMTATPTTPTVMTTTTVQRFAVIDRDRCEKYSTTIFAERGDAEREVNRLALGWSGKNIALGVGYVHDDGTIDDITTTIVPVIRSTPTPLADALAAAIEAERIADAAYYDSDCAVEGPERDASLAAGEAVATARLALTKSSELREWSVTVDGDEVDEVIASGLTAALDLASASISDSAYDIDETSWADVRVHCAATGETDRLSVAVDPHEPVCTVHGRCGEEHDWCSPHDLVGGLKENPGVWGHGGGVKIHTVCSHCGAHRHVDTWAQRRDTGEQGLQSVSYAPADQLSLEWVSAQEPE